ncbi:hypothetical protein JW978_00605 [Candidatus Dojkabacteria bacterium]|nr:hypothetical protein [Candidatus Dojkabacteria bacterium]
MNLLKRKNKIILLSCITIFILCGIIALGIGAFLLISADSGNGDSGDGSQINYQNYLGYQERDISIKNYYDLDTELMLFYYNLETLSDYDYELYAASEDEDAETFFTYYSEYNAVSGELMSQAKAINEFMDNPSNEGDLPVGDLVGKAYAKERWSFFYWIPIVEKLVKSKHQSIETSRTSIYNYIKSDPGLESVDRQGFLDEYGLKNVEDIRTLGDSDVERMARDPELRTAIDWTKISSDVAKSGVEAYVDVVKTATSGEIPNPIKDTIKNGLVDIMDGKIETINDQMPSDSSNTSQADKVTLGLSQNVTNAIDQTLGKDLGKDWDDVSDDKKDEILEKLLSEIENGPLGIAHSPDTGEENKFIIPEGTWDLLCLTDGTVPVEMNDIEIEEGKTTEVVKPTLDIANVIDPDILISLGGLVETSVSLPDVENPTSCEDFGILDNSGAASSCLNSYEYCMQYPTQILDGYSACISAGGGCWDIGRSANYESPDSCPSDLSVMDPNEFRHNDNVRYCECIHDCQDQYTTQKDCSSELKTCCSNIL